MILYVETHWIMSVVQSEDWDATKLLDPPGHSAPQVYLPAFCIAEAIARIRTKAFLSGNTGDFDSSKPAGKELASAGIKSFSSAQNALGWLTASAPPDEPSPA